MKVLFSLILGLSFVSAAVSAEVLERNTFASKTLELELGASAGYESILDLPFDIQEELEVVITGQEGLLDTQVSAQVIRVKPFSKEDDAKLKLQVVVTSAYQAASVQNIPVGLRVVGAQSGIVHYLENLNVTVLPKLTIRVWVDEQDQVQWSTPKTISLRKHASGVEVVFLLTQANEESVFIHGQSGPIPHATRDDLMFNAGDTYTVLVPPSDKPATGQYWEHQRETQADARKIEFNSL